MSSNENKLSWANKKSISTDQNQSFSFNSIMNEQLQIKLQLGN